MDVQVMTWLQNEATTLFADRKSAEKVENPVAVIRESLPKQQKSAKRVEIPSTAVRKSLPKQRKCAKKVENSKLAA